MPKSVKSNRLKHSTEHYRTFEGFKGKDDKPEHWANAHTALEHLTKDLKEKRLNKKLFASFLHPLNKKWFSQSGMPPLLD